MAESIEEQLSRRAFATQAEASQNAHLRISYPRRLWSRAGQTRHAQDQTVFRQWRFGFFVFYGAVALLLFCGLAVMADWPRTITTAAVGLNSPAVATHPSKHQN